MTLLGVNLDYRVPSPVYSHLPPLCDPEKIRLEYLTNLRWEDSPALRSYFNKTPPVNPQVDRETAAVFACIFGTLSTTFTAMILTRTSFESKTKTVISFAGGATVATLTYMNPLIGLVACAILGVIACAISKKPSSTDGLLKMLASNERRNFPYDDPRNFFLIDATLQRVHDVLFRRQEQELQNMPPIRPMFHPPVIHPWDQMPPPRFVLPHFFFNDFPAFQDLQPRHIAGG